MQHLESDYQLIARDAFEAAVRRHQAERMREGFSSRRQTRGHAVLPVLAPGGKRRVVPIDDSGTPMLNVRVLEVLMVAADLVQRPQSFLSAKLDTAS
jgi:hypothetical protein